MNFKLITALLVTSIPLQVQSQDHTMIEDYTLGERELVVFPFGMEQKITVGKVEESGNLLFDWRGFDISVINNTEIFMADLANSFDRGCDETVVDKSNQDGVSIVEAGNVYVWEGTRWLGALTPASSVELKEHLEDKYGKHAVTGSYLKWIYSSADAQYHASCKATMGFYGGITVETYKDFALDFKQGWNTVLFEISEVAPVKDAADTVVKTSISTIDSYPEDMVWFFKRF